MNNTVTTEGIVEQSLNKVLKKNGIGVSLFCLLFGILLLAIAMLGIYLGFAPEYISYLQAILFLLLGAALAGIGVYKMNKRSRLKNDLYSALLVCGTPQDPLTVAEQFNREYEAAPKNPVLEKAGLFFTENYVMTRGGDVGIAPHSAVLFALQQGSPKNSSLDDTTFGIYCRYQPALKNHSLPAIRVFGKPGTVLLQAIREKGYPILPYSPGSSADRNLPALAIEDYQQFENIINERLRRAK